MDVRGKAESNRDAFLLGVAGAIVALVVFFCVTYHVAIEVTILLFVLLPVAASFLCSVMVALYRPKAAVMAGPSGYACAWGVFALVCATDALVGILLLLHASVTLLAGYLGQLAARWWLPRRFPRVGPPQEPVCPQCGYGLYYSTHRMCPDCGRVFRSVEIDMRLAYWEDGVLKPRSLQGTSDVSREETRPS